MQQAVDRIVEYRAYNSEYLVRQPPRLDGRGVNLTAGLALLAGFVEQLIAELFEDVAHCGVLAVEFAGGAAPFVDDVVGEERGDGGGVTVALVRVQSANSGKLPVALRLAQDRSDRKDRALANQGGEAVALGVPSQPGLVGGCSTPRVSSICS